MSRRACRVDENHGEIVQTFRDLGAHVTDTSGAGNGFPDLVLSHRGKTLLVEVKNGKKPPSERKLTKDQRKLHEAMANHGVQVHVVLSQSDAMALLGAKPGA